MSDTGLTEEQYNLLEKIFWHPDDMEVEDWDKLFDEIKTSEELHQLAWNYNWDDGSDIPLWIIRQPFCDRGTALLLYWRAGAQWFCQYSNREEVPEHEIDNYDLIKEIEERYLSGYYTRQNISFDPTNDGGNDCTKMYSEYETKQGIPPFMKEASPGKVLERASF